MAIRLPIFGEVTVEASSTDKYTGQTITPAALSGGILTLTSADIGADSGALLSLNKEYRIVVDGNDYWDVILDNTDADEHFFRVVTTYGNPLVTSTITKITELTRANVKTTLDELITKSLNVEVVSVDEDWTVDDETIIFANSTAANVTLQLPKISDVGPGRLLIVSADVGGNSVLVSPNAADQIAGGGADTDKTLTTADVVEVYVSTTTDAVNDWKLVLSV